MGGMDALALVESPDHVCCRYRVAPFARWLNSAGHRLVVQTLAKSPLERFRQFAAARHFDSIILQRKLLSSLELRWLRVNAKRLVYDFDDAVFARDSFDPRGPSSRRRQARFARTMRYADQVIAGNEFLAARAVHLGAEPEWTVYIPTCIETSFYQKPSGTKHGENVRLVWIGSASTIQGLVQRRELWARINARFPQVVLRVICDEFPDVGMPIEAIPWSKTTEIDALDGSDIGIAWMPDDLWSRGKCALKVLQYFASGLPVVANPVGVHVEVVEPERNGFLSTSDDDWIQAIGRLVEQPELRQRMGLAGRALVERRFDVSQWAGKWCSTLLGTGADNRVRSDSPRNGFVSLPHARHAEGNNVRRGV
jgi:Glycosyl transferases group 1